MTQAVKSGLLAPVASIEWVTIDDGILYGAQIPIKADGSIETGDTHLAQLDHGQPQGAVQSGWRWLGRRRTGADLSDRNEQIPGSKYHF
jgi:hypothetical protein